MQLEPYRRKADKQCESQGPRGHRKPKDVVQFGLYKPNAEPQSRELKAAGQLGPCMLKANNKRRAQGPWGRPKPKAAVLLGPYRPIANTTKGDTWVVGSAKAEGCGVARAVYTECLQPVGTQKAEVQFGPCRPKVDSQRGAHGLWVRSKPKAAEQ